MLLNGDNIRPANGTNVAYFDHSKFNARMNAAARLSGPKRYAAYGALDIDISNDGAPWAASSNSNHRIFVSDKVGCFTTSASYRVDLAALCVR